MNYVTSHSLIKRQHTVAVLDSQDGKKEKVSEVKREDDEGGVEEKTDEKDVKPLKTKNKKGTFMDTFADKSVNNQVSEQS